MGQRRNRSPQAAFSDRVVPLPMALAAVVSSLARATAAAPNWVGCSATVLRAVVGVFLAPARPRTTTHPPRWEISLGNLMTRHRQLVEVFSAIGRTQPPQIPFLPLTVFLAIIREMVRRIMGGSLVRNLPGGSLETAPLSHSRRFLELPPHRIISSSSSKHSNCPFWVPIHMA